MLALDKPGEHALAPVALFTLLMVYGHLATGAQQLADDEKEAALIAAADGTEKGAGGAAPPAQSTGSKLYNSLGKLSNRFFHE